MKFLLFVIFLAVVWWIWTKRARRPQDILPKVDSPPEKMVDCQHCHVHLPASESLREGDVFYCCAAHRQAGPRPGAK